MYQINRLLVLASTVVMLLLSTTLVAQGPQNISSPHFEIPDPNPTDGNIFGHVTCRGEHLPFVTIMIKGTTNGTATDETGHYLMVNQDVGDWILKAQCLGYKPLEKKITIAAGKSIEINFELVEDLIMTEGVVITAARHQENRREAATIVNVVDNKTLEAVTASSLADGLNFQPGLRVENNCQNCGFTQLRMNGLEGPYSQVLIDSRPIFSALNGVYGLEQIPANMIERVEVVRGGGSALYGANAIGGTVNIITREPVSNSFQVNAHQSWVNGESPDRVMSFNTSLVTKDYKTGLFLFGITRDREQWNANPEATWVHPETGLVLKDDFSEMSAIKNSSMGFRAYHKPSQLSKISLEFHHLNEFRRGGNKFDQLAHHSDITEQAKSIVSGGGITWDLFSKNMKNKYSLYTSVQNVDRATYYGANQDPSGYGQTDELTFVGGGQFVSNFDRLAFAPSVFTLGAEYRTSHLTDNKLALPNNILISDQSIQTAGLFAQNQWDMGWVKVLAGLRMDQHNKLDNPVLNPRFNLLFNLNEHFQFRGSFATGFRAPQIFDEDLHIAVAGAQAVRTYNADDLHEERSQSYSGSVDYTGEMGDVQMYLLAEGFYTRLNDVFVTEINLDEETGEAYMYRTNGDGAQVAGVNFETKIAFSRALQLQGGFTVQSSRYNKEELVWEPTAGDDRVPLYTRDLMRTPSNYGYFVANYSPLKNLKACVTGNYVGAMQVPHLIEPDTEYTQIITSESFFDLGVKLSWDTRLNGQTRVQLSCGVHNIFNSYQDDFDTGMDRDAGYIYGPGRPRTYFVGIKLGNVL